MLMGVSSVLELMSTFRNVEWDLTSSYKIRHNVFMTLKSMLTVWRRRLWNCGRGQRRSAVRGNGPSSVWYMGTWSGRADVGRGSNVSTLI